MAPRHTEPLWWSKSGSRHRTVSSSVASDGHVGVKNQGLTDPASCRQCGAHVRSIARFCPSCGAKRLDQAAAATEETHRTEASQPYFTQTPLSQPVNWWAAPGSPDAYGPSLGAPAVRRSEGTNGNATASLILGVISLVFLGFIFGVPAILLGSRARKQIAQGDGSGSGIAMGGVVSGWIGTVLSILAIVVVGIVLVAGVASDEIGGNDSVSVGDCTTADYFATEDQHGITKVDCQSPEAKTQVISKADAPGDCRLADFIMFSGQGYCLAPRG